MAVIFNAKGTSVGSFQIGRKGPIIKNNLGIFEFRNSTDTGFIEIKAGGSTPTSSDSLTTKAYVDSIATGLDLKESVRVATTTNITLSGLQTIDGVTLIAGDRVLVKDQTTQTENGIYVVSSTAWNRSTDADNTPGNEVSGGMFTFIEEGTVNGDTGWVLSSPNGVAVLGTDNLIFSQFSAAGFITASNVGSGGVGVFKQKTGSNLEFRNINAGSTKISVVNDTTFNEIDIDVVESNLNLNNIGNILGIAKGGTGGTTQATARTGLGSTTIGDALFTTPSAADARTTLGLTIGVDVQPFDGNTAKTNVVQSWSRSQNFAMVTLVDGTNISWNLNTSQVATVTLAGNRTLNNPTNMQSGATYILIVKQDGTGNRTLSYGSAYKWPNGTPPILSTTASAVDILTFISDGTNMYGMMQGDFK